MKTIHKYLLLFRTDHMQTTFEMPFVHQIVRFGFQDEEAMVWAMVDTESPMTPITLRIVGTGWPVDEQWRYHGTTQEGPFVWHVFEIPQAGSAS